MGEWGVRAPLEPSPQQVLSPEPGNGEARLGQEELLQTKRFFQFLGRVVPLLSLGLGRSCCVPWKPLLAP